MEVSGNGGLFRVEKESEYRLDRNLTSGSAGWMTGLARVVDMVSARFSSIVKYRYSMAIGMSARSAISMAARLEKGSLSRE